MAHEGSEASAHTHIHTVTLTPTIMCIPTSACVRVGRNTSIKNLLNVSKLRLLEGKPRMVPFWIPDDRKPVTCHNNHQQKSSPALQHEGIGGTHPPKPASTTELGTAVCRRGGGGDRDRRRQRQRQRQRKTERQRQREREERGRRREGYWGGGGGLLSH
jgi:hypothetical protein